MGFGDEHLIPLVDEGLGYLVDLGEGRALAVDAVLRGGPQERAEASMRPLETGQ